MGLSTRVLRGVCLLLSWPQRPGAVKRGLDDRSVSSAFVDHRKTVPSMDMHTKKVITHELIVLVKIHPARILFQGKDTSSCAFPSKYIYCLIFTPAFDSM